MNGYEARHQFLLDGVPLLEEFVSELLADRPRIDRVCARAKSPDRFAKKAERVDATGAKKYADPLAQIQDQIAARVVVFYLDDVPPVLAALERYLQKVESRALVPESSWEFGYFGHHSVFVLPEEVVPEGFDSAAYPRFFELQIKTLFQHAWSEAEHDLGYKSPRELDANEQRRLAYSAAQAWGADQAFKELYRDLFTTEQRCNPDNG
jgi:ppGpp synthetase/RelA/SpoT-type nucleotidyltranferase